MFNTINSKKLFIKICSFHNNFLVLLINKQTCTKTGCTALNKVPKIGNLRFSCLDIAAGRLPPINQYIISK